MGCRVEDGVRPPMTAHGVQRAANAIRDQFNVDLAARQVHRKDCDRRPREC